MEARWELGVGEARIGMKKHSLVFAIRVDFDDGDSSWYHYGESSENIVVIGDRDS